RTNPPRRRSRARPGQARVRGRRPHRRGPRPERAVRWLLDPRVRSGRLPCRTAPRSGTAPREVKEDRMSGAGDHLLRDAAEELRRFGLAFAAGAGRLVAEIRAPDTPQQYGKPVTVCGFFELTTPAGQRALWEAVKQLMTAAPDDQPEGIYLTVNPLNPAL